jgi:cbb3-type cytochrome oxidase maturation protein
MSVIYIALPAALVLAACALGAFLWSVRAGQYDDLATPAVRMLLDDDGASSIVQRDSQASTGRD